MQMIPRIHNDFEEGSDGDLDSISINIRSIDFPDFRVSLHPFSKVSELKQRIVDQQNIPKSKTLKLIYAGKILEDSNSLNSYDIKDMGFVHCVVRETETDTPTLTAPILNNTPQTPNHTIIDINDWTLRDEFLARQLEQRFLEENGHSQHAQISPFANTNTVTDGSTEDFFFGIVLGFLLGVIMLFWLLDGNLPRKFKYGIVTGVSFNLIFGFAKISR
eukprot:TRINITY_DN16847_c0_g2_i1.p1 TRINITY_DN16847_c0_g2~~TRINITY_DN16847_c0_g2_i1.p1  ORF type:complete len:218 (+),score=46.09 TRINITY_DN16847_c0_g2_i1:129-782(+)